MDKNSEVANFEEYLKKNLTKKRIPLYSNSKQVDITVCKPKDVLLNVSTQLKAIQSADIVKCERKQQKHLYLYKKYGFLPIKELPVTEEVSKRPTPSNKFETQFVTDTQLINIIEDAEALNTHKGMTQEFDNSFSHSDSCLRDRVVTYKEQQNPGISNKDEGTSIKENDLNSIQEFKISIAQEKDAKIDDNDKLSIENDINTQTDGGLTELLNNCIEIDDEDSERPPSPIFNPIKSIIKSSNPSPLVYTLKSFEEFEKIAVPLIDDNVDMDKAKHLINSQILDKELFLNQDKGFNFEQLSPVLEIKKEKDKKLNKIGNNETVTSAIQNNSLEDEILFSSDEEIDYIHKELQDLPFTCALETSFYDTSDVLDKTMYVGFQTASNKSIQINSDSFTKAQSILTDFDKDIKTDPTLTELVKVFDGVKCDDEQSEIDSIVKAVEIGFDEDNEINEHKIKSDDHTNSKDDTNDKSIKILQKKELIPDIKQIPLIIDSIADLNHNNSKRHVNEFTTSSNKRIKLSEQALERCRKIIQDIDFDEVLDTQTNLIDIDSKNENVINLNNEDIPKSPKGNVAVVDNEFKLDDKMLDTLVQDKINDDLIIQEFENIEMSLEEDKSTKEANFVRFKTASKENISISNDALKKCQQIFQDIDFNEQMDEVPSKDGKILETMMYVKNKDNNTLLHYNNIEASKEETVPQFSGFKTASNKQIDVSEQALANSMNIFKDLGPTDLVLNNIPEESKEDTEILLKIDYNRPSTSKATFGGFKTANNRVIKISKDALAKTKNVFKNIDKEEPVQLNKDTFAFKGYKTASNKQVNVSEKSKVLSYDKNISNQTDFTEEPNLDFRKSKDNPQKISEEALIKSKKPFKDINVMNNYLNNSQNIALVEPPPVFQGFKTASNKAVNISTEALARSKKIFQDIDVNSEPVKKDSKDAIAQSQKLFQGVGPSNISKEHSIEFENKVDNAVTKFQGFKTASNKAVRISDDDLLKSKKLFQDIDSISNEMPLVTKSNSRNEANLAFQGFKTASNKAVKISDDALLKSKKLLQDIDLISDEMPLETKSNSRNEANLAFQGFKTASNKAVKISDDALLKSKKLLQDIDSISDEMPLDSKVKPQNVVLKGFMSANNKTVKIDAQALAKSKKLFDEIPEFNFKNDTKISNFEGFKTGNNKAVEISEKALATSRKVFEDIGCSQILNMRGLKGFQTANKERVNISEDALIESKKLFQNLDVPNNLSLESDFKRANELDALSENNFAQIDNDPSVHSNKDAKPKCDIVEIIDTQVLNDFEETLYTEDFRKSPKRNKRSGSPILSCPRAKKRKFETPYKTKEMSTNIIVSTSKQVIVDVNQSNFIFDANYKKNKSYTLKDMLKLEDCSNQIKEKYILSVNFDDLLQFEFNKERNDINDHILTMEDIKVIFITSVNKNLIPKGWIENHLQLIIWKLISYEIKFPKTMKNVCTARNVIEQLKYRYDKELYNAQRPVLRKILEKDDTSMRTMVLCVVKIFVDGAKADSFTNTTNIELLLSDGWYCVKATIDKMLTKLVCAEKIVVGTKIVTNGAELVNCEQGVAPWEDTTSVRLKIFGNSTRRARWDARLGCHSNAAMLTHLSSVKLDGGKVSKLRVYVTRVYPALYVEKFEDGSTVTRSERLEHLHQMKYEAERQVLMEKLYEEVEKEFADQDLQDSESFNASNKRPCLDSGSQIAKMMKWSKDPMEFKNNLTHSQHALLSQYTNAHRERLLHDIQDRIRQKMAKNGLCATRNVVPVMKVRVAGVDDRSGVEVTKGMMSIWKPNDAIQEIITEGAWIDVMNVVPTAIRYSEIQISAGRQSVFNLSKYKESDNIKPYTKLLKRTCYLLKDLATNPTSTTDYNEIDTVGMIFTIDPSITDFESLKGQTFQNVYLADADNNIICINFWGGLKKFGFENVLDTGQIVSCTNLQKRAGNTKKNIPQYRVTEFTYFTKTPKNEEAKKIMDELNKKLLGLDKRKFCEDCIVLRNNFTICKVQNNENISPYRLNNSDYNISKHRMFIDTPKRIDDFNLTGLDFESSFKQTETQELSPKSLERKRRVNEKISKLRMYGEPPPLSKIHIINKSKNASSSYKSPLISKSDFSKSVVNVENNPEDSPKTVISRNNSRIDVSPVISMNKTYVKRSIVNPVKLNFSDSVAIEENGVETDGFADEFDGSPPLSFD